jgi:hypothetical protein
MTGELEGEVGFYAGVQFAGAAFEDIPAAVGKLATPNVCSALVLKDGVYFASPIEISDVVGAKG